MSIQSFFNKIKPQVQAELLNSLIESHTEITIKIENVNYIKSKLLSKKSATDFKIHKVNSEIYSNTPITCLFQIGNDRYFFYSHLTSSTTDWVLSTPKDIFHLQRRDNYRMIMPIGVKYNCDIIYINGRKSKIPIEIRDLSLGGCLLSLKGRASDSTINPNDEIDIYLKLDKFEFTKLALTIKHIKYIESQNSSSLGASFFEPDSDTVSDLQSLLLHLDRIHRGKGND